MIAGTSGSVFGGLAGAAAVPLLRPFGVDVVMRPREEIFLLGSRKPPANEVSDEVRVCI